MCCVFGDSDFCKRRYLEEEEVENLKFSESVGFFNTGFANGKLLATNMSTNSETKNPT